MGRPRSVYTAMGHERLDGASRGSPNAVPGRWRALPRWAKRSVRVPFLSEQARLVILAIVVGVLTGWGAVGFVLLLDAIAGFARGPLAATLAWLGSAHLVLLPVLGGLLAGPLTHRVAREARGHAVPLVMMALVRRGGRHRPCLHRETARGQTSSGGLRRQALEFCRNFETSSHAGRELRGLIP